MSKVNGLLDGMSHRDLLDLKQQTWSGRGRHPGWITAALATGIRIDSLLA